MGTIAGLAENGKMINRSQEQIKPNRPKSESPNQTLPEATFQFNFYVTEDISSYAWKICSNRVFTKNE